MVPSAGPALPASAEPQMILPWRPHSLQVEPKYLPATTRLCLSPEAPPPKGRVREITANGTKLHRPRSPQNFSPWPCPGSQGVPSLDIWRLSDIDGSTGAGWHSRRRSAPRDGCTCRRGPVDFRPGLVSRTILVRRGTRMNSTVLRSIGSGGYY